MKQEKAKKLANETNRFKNQDINEKEGQQRGQMKKSSKRKVSQEERGIVKRERRKKAGI